MSKRYDDYPFLLDISFFEMLMGFRTYGKKVSLFGIDMRVPNNEFEKLQEQIESLEIVVKMLNCKIDVLSNNSAVNIVFQTTNGKTLILQFGIHCQMIDPDKAYDNNGKLKRIQIIEQIDLDHFELISKASYKFAKIVHEFQSYL